MGSFSFKKDKDDYCNCFQFDSREIGRDIPIKCSPVNFEVIIVVGCLLRIFFFN